MKFKVLPIVYIVIALTFLNFNFINCSKVQFNGDQSQQKIEDISNSEDHSLACIFNSAKINHNDVITAWKHPLGSESEPCLSEKRKCFNGNLSGSFSYNSCLNKMDIASASIVITTTTLSSSTSISETLCEQGQILMNGQCTVPQLTWAGGLGAFYSASLNERGGLVAIDYSVAYENNPTLNFDPKFNYTITSTANTINPKTVVFLNGEVNFGPTSEKQISVIFKTSSLISNVPVKVTVTDQYNNTAELTFNFEVKCPQNQIEVGGKCVTPLNKNDVLQAYYSSTCDISTNEIISESNFCELGTVTINPYTGETKFNMGIGYDDPFLSPKPTQTLYSQKIFFDLRDSNVSSYFDRLVDTPDFASFVIKSNKICKSFSGINMNNPYSLGAGFSVGGAYDILKLAEGDLVVMGYFKDTVAGYNIFTPSNSNTLTTTKHRTMCVKLAR